VGDEHKDAFNAELAASSIASIGGLQALSNDDVDALIAKLKLPLGPKKKLQRGFKAISPSGTGGEPAAA